MHKKACVTGGSGFIGSFLVKRLVYEGWEVIVIDSMLRGIKSRLLNVKKNITIVECDIRDEESVTKAIEGCDVVFHLAAVNGTENFYKHPELVFDVGVKGALSVINACFNSKVKNVIFASSAEVYQTPTVIPTSENIPLTLPDSLNPRYSYGGSKIASELIAFNYHQTFFEKVQVFRPHNVYGPDMGWKHVIPQFIQRMKELKSQNQHGFSIYGSGKETRAFCFVDDIVDGILTMFANGGHREVYHIGNNEEVTIAELAQRIATKMNVSIELVHEEAPMGATNRRCPDIGKMNKIGFEPKVNLSEGLEKTIAWYQTNSSKATNKLL